MKAMAMTSFLLFCNGKLLPSVASTHAMTWPHKPSWQKGDAPVPHLWLFIIIFQVIIMHGKPNEQQEKPRGRKAARSPIKPRKAVPVRVPIPSGMGSGTAPGGPTLRSRTALLPWGFISGTAPLPLADEPGPELVWIRAVWLKESGKGRSYLSMHFLQAKEVGRTV